MELGSAEHKQLLRKSIFKVAWKTASIGIFLGILLIIPSLVRENSFSAGLSYAGWAIMLGFISYALIIAWKKYQKVMKDF
ncbi:hypothetical protein J3998_11390 [Thiomicrorhabdus sp. 6S2-11]|jgi:hypothetical protein|uniref:Uncharacterized protein n=1 Tax=Thiomicrorhabdus marina TaxID=2818442 RepID=A0ABS3Q8B3_9GAMM|nr:hypothetical protein [Thiomicrorhabdus marina]MBO1928179.1 hypothetical protein [Thiomicrorhabdus marina]